MLIDSMKYNGKCSCGREHKMATRAVVIEGDCLADFEGIMGRYAVDGKRCALYDENTYRATGGRRLAAGQEIILRAENLHADETATARVLGELEEDVEVMVAVGSGTIHDIARYCAHERGIRFVSVPTAASVDGFCSTVCAMTWYGFKRTLPALAPEIVIADTSVIRSAPARLVKSGVGDIVAKYTALADWKIAHVLAGEYFCPRICAIMREAVDMVVASVPLLLSGEEAAYADVTYALIMSGVAMQMMGNSRPASGSEHHISHLIEMQPEALPVAFPALHGEKTGVGAVLAADEYHRLAGLEEITARLAPYRPIDMEEAGAFFGERLAQAIRKENAQDCLCGVTAEQIAAHWEEIRAIVGEIPSGAALRALLEKLGAKRSLGEIGVAEEESERILTYSPLVRNRLTLMRVRRMMGRDTGKR